MSTTARLTRTSRTAATWALEAVLNAATPLSFAFVMIALYTWGWVHPLDSITDPYMLAALVTLLLGWLANGLLQILDAQAAVLPHTPNGYRLGLHRPLPYVPFVIGSAWYDANPEVGPQLVCRAWFISRARAAHRITWWVLEEDRNPSGDIYR